VLPPFFGVAPRAAQSRVKMKGSAAVDLRKVQHPTLGARKTRRNELVRPCRLIGSPNLAERHHFDVDSTHWIWGGVILMRSVSRQIGWLCLLLTLLSAYGFATHQHFRSSDEAQCAFCVVTHSASPKATSAPLKVTFVAVSTFRAEPVATKQCLIAFSLCVRPPPSV